MVQGASDRVVHDQSQGKRSVIVGALRAHREIGIAAPYENRLVGIDPSRDDRAVRNIANFNSGAKIRSARCLDFCRPLSRKVKLDTKTWSEARPQEKQGA